MTTRYTIADLADDLDGNARELVHLLRAHKQLYEALRSRPWVVQRDDIQQALDKIEAAEKRE